MTTRLPNKASDENLDYTFDFGARLDAGDAITTVSAVRKSGDVVLGTVSKSGTAVTFWLSGGTAGTTSLVLVEAVTAGGRTFVEPALVQVV